VFREADDLVSEAFDRPVLGLSAASKTKPPAS
jgi:hypothetical protein